MMMDSHSISSNDRDRSFTLPLTDPSNHDPDDGDDDEDESTPTNTDIAHVGRTAWEDQDSMATPTHDATPTNDGHRELLYSYSSLDDESVDESEPSRGITAQIKRLLSKRKKKKHRQSDLATIYSEGTYHSASDYSQQKRHSASLSSHESASLKSRRLFSSKKTRHHSASDPIYDTLPVQPIVILRDTEEHISDRINV